MFSTLGLFSKVPCPIGDDCKPPSCIFTHRDSDVPTQSPSNAILDDHRNKRIKLTEDNQDEEVVDRPKSKPFFGAFKRDPPSPSGDPDLIHKANKRTHKHAGKDRARRSISPPFPKREGKPRPPSPPAVATSKATSEKKPIVRPPAAIVTESLNPRMVTNNPASHADRMSFVKKMHEIMSNLNKSTARSEDPTRRALHLDKYALIKLVLDEEEEIACGKPTTYTNRIRQRIGAMSKMTVDQWQIIRQRNHPQDKLEAKPTSPEKQVISTGLSTPQEVQLVSQLAADQSQLGKYGYVTSPPSDWDIRETRAAVALNRGYEQCERCGSRFQVFPDRREDGALTDGGQCTHHYGRVFLPKRQSAQPVDSVQEKRYTCCSQALGTAGCTTADTHVFKFEDKKRLASILQFRRTPPNDAVPADRAVAFDCEMIYTVSGFELARLTAVSWPSGEELLDILVKPFGAILDLNTRFSGISADDFTNAVPMDNDLDPMKLSSNGTKPPLKIAESPDVARDIFFKLISPNTPLIGHALENDLIATRIIHPNIVDTVLLFPHPRGLPYRFALRNLTQEKLGRTIQAGGAAGHDSKEDARAAGDLVRVALAAKWKAMKREGFSYVNEKLVSPLSKAGVGSAIETIREDASSKLEAQRRSRKRSHDEAEKEEDVMDFWKD